MRREECETMKEELTFEQALIDRLDVLAELLERIALALEDEVNNSD